MRAECRVTEIAEATPLIATTGDHGWAVTARNDVAGIEVMFFSTEPIAVTDVVSVEWSVHRGA